MAAGPDLPLDLTRLRAAYAAGRLDPQRLIEALSPALAASDGDAVWISRLDEAGLRARALGLAAMAPAERGPLWGVPFAVKDNIDVAGLATTAGCPAFAYRPETDAPVVARLLAAGAILLGKTNLDQLATGLVGVRSPYGTAKNPFGAHLVPGGSSSGSAVAVACGLASFALGTDTAGSGRVPAGFNNIIGLKPTRGLLPTTGVVPACRSLDCVSVFALTAADALAVLDVAAGPDPADAFGRTGTQRPLSPDERPLRVGVPKTADLTWHGDDAYAGSFAAFLALQAWLAPRAVDTGALREAALLLYAGPWVAERLAAIEGFLARHADEMLPVTRAIIEGGRRFSAVDTFRAMDRLEALRRDAERLFQAIDVLIVPTAPTLPSRAAVEAEPVAVNSVLGTWTNFVNLLDLAAIAVPAGFTVDGRPFGVTLIAPAWRDRALAGLAQSIQRQTGLGLGATGHRLPEAEPTITPPPAAGILLFVVGAHLRGEPLHHELLAQGATFAGEAVTACDYRLKALSTIPAKPGLVRVGDGTGAAVPGELWRLPLEGFARFVAAIPPPMAIGSVELLDGRRVRGFLCEPVALDGAQDITSSGGWRAWRRAAADAQPSGRVSPPVAQSR